MAKVRKCDTCKREFVADDKVEIVIIKCFVEDTEIPEESNPEMVRKDLCSDCAELLIYSWDNDDNIKAMLTDIRQRRARLGKPKSKKTD